MRLTALIAVVALGCTVQTDRTPGSAEGGGGGGGGDAAGVDDQDGQAPGGGEAGGRGAEEEEGNTPSDDGGEEVGENEASDEGEADAGSEAEGEGEGEGGEDVAEGEGEGVVDPPPDELTARLTVTPPRIGLGEVARGESSDVAEVTVTNEGDAASEPLSFGLEGNPAIVLGDAPSGDDCAFDQVLEPGDSCQIGVVFTPAAPGPAFAALAVGGEVVLVSAFGLGFGPAVLSGGDLDGHDFGQIDEPAEQAFSISNTGELPTQPIEVDVSGAGFAAAVDGCAGQELDGGDRCEVTVSLTPEAGAEHVGVLRVWAPRAGLVVFGLTGRGPDLPPDPGPGELQAEPLSVDFGVVAAGEAAAPRLLALSNPGDSALDDLLWDVEGDDDFEVTPADDGGCDPGGSLLPDESCELVIEFDPVGPGRRGAVVVASAEGVRPVAVGLTGVAEAEDNGGEPGDHALAIAGPDGPQVVDFGFVEGPATAEVTVTNIGDGPSGSLRTRLQGDPSFAVLGGGDRCVGRTLASQGRCVIEVTLSPQANGGVEGGLSVWSAGDDPEDDAAEIALAGAGVGFDPAVLEIDPVAHDFGEIDVGERSDDELFTVRNTGDLPARALRIALDGDHPGDFAVALIPNGCAEGIDLPGGAACLVGARFEPDAGNARSAQLAVAADGAELPAIAQLSGTGHSLLNGDLAGIPMCFERLNTAGHRVGVFNSRHHQNPSQRHAGHDNWRSFCQSNGWDDHNRGAGNSNNSCEVLENGYVTMRHLDGGGNWDEDDYPPNRPEGAGHVFHTCIIFQNAD